MQAFWTNYDRDRSVTMTLAEPDENSSSNIYKAQTTVSTTTFIKRWIRQHGFLFLRTVISGYHFGQSCDMWLEYTATQYVGFLIGWLSYQLTNALLQEKYGHELQPFYYNYTMMYSYNHPLGHPRKKILTE